MNVQIEIPISTIMTKDVISVDVKDSLEKAEHLLKKHKIRHIPVTANGNKLVGMVSINDILRISFADGAYRDEEDFSSTIYEMFSIRSLMRSKLETVHPDASIKEVAEKFVESEYHSLPVVAGEELVGIITTTDLIKYLLSL